jgi:hypothetical protein
MNMRILILRAVLAAGWIVLAALTTLAIAERGLGALVTTFVGDFAHPWRAQFLTDFSLHLVMAAAWIAFRARTRPLGALLALLAMSLGALFTVPYVLLALARAKGDSRIFLLGRHANAA